MESTENVVNEISELRNTTLSPCSLNTTVAIVMSSLAELYRNRVLFGVYYYANWPQVNRSITYRSTDSLQVDLYLLTESRVQA